MIIAAATLATIVGKPLNPNMISVVMGLAALPSGIDQPQRLARLLGQTCHESMGWTYDRKIWGNTLAQIRYDTRTDLGNTAARDGDGYLYRGRTGIQITGKYNTTMFRDWCRARFSVVPDFVAAPDLMNTDPWEGIGPVWYWATHRHLGKSINDWCHAGLDEVVTRAINGGVNGLADRINLTVRASVLLCGHVSIRAFQSAHQIAADGVTGPITRGALHKTLCALPLVTFAA